MSESLKRVFNFLPR